MDDGPTTGEKTRSGSDDDFVIGPVLPGGATIDASSRPAPEPTLAAIDQERTLADPVEGDNSGWQTGPVSGPSPGLTMPSFVTRRAPPEVPGYEILGEVGRGGMGIVYKARQVRLNRIVALKMILAGNHAAPESLVRFMTEAEAVAKLRHPSIVQIYSIGEVEGLPYIELEFVPGGNLDETLSGTPRPAREAARLIEILALAIAEAHRVGIVHRDLKPANVLLMADGTPKIADFGLAKALDITSGLTDTEAILGSPSYMAPEQAEGKTKQVGPSADVYSLGAIFYELLTGRPPFRGPTSLLTLEQVRSAEPVPPSRLQPGLPRDPETIALKCLAKDPAKRYASADALAEDLRRYLAGEPIQARRSGPVERAWRWCRRNPVVAALAASIATLLVVLAVGSSLAAIWLRQERDAILAQRLRADEADRQRRVGLVDALMTAAPDSVPFILGALQTSRDLAIPVLRNHFDESGAGFERRLRAAVSLTILGEPREPFLIESIPTAPANECRNLATALATVKTSAITALLERAGAEPDPVTRERFAAVLLHLGEPRAAGESLTLAADPIRRAAFIHNFAAWHSDLSGLPDLLRGSDTPAFRGGMALALGSIDPRTLAETEREGLTRVLLALFRSDPDGATHAAAGWALRRWKVELPAIPTSHEPHAGWHWFVNGRRMTMMEVRSGIGVMGDPTVEGTRTHTIALSRPFFMCDREVSVDLFWEFIADPEYPAEEKPRNWPGPFAETSPTADCPVNNATWQDAILFCNWLSHKEWRTPCYERVGTGADGWRCNFNADGYRLPTEAEWEYACRAGTTTHFAFGDQPDLLTSYGNVTAMRSVAGGACLPNDWGLFDMLGNTWEWCWDGKDAPFAPFVLDPVAPAQGPTRVARGGAFGAGAYYCRSAFRFHFPPTARNKSYGFRVVCGDPEHDPSGGRRIDRLERLADSLLTRPEARDEALALRTTCGRWHADQSHWDEAAADFAVVIAAKAGDDWSPADARVNPGEIVGWDRGFARAVTLRPDDPQPWLSWARFYAELSLWDLAAARAAEALERNPDQLIPWERMSVLPLAAGDADAYRRDCARMIERFSRAPGPSVGWRLAMACTLSPDATADPSRLADQAEKAVATFPGQAGPLFAAGLAHFRAGRFERAISRLGEAVTLNPNLSSAFPVLAMAHHRLGQSNEARRWMEKASRWWDGAIAQALKNPEGRPPVPWFHHWARFVILHDEAKRTIGGTAPPIDPRLRLLKNQARARLGLPPVPELPDDVFAYPAGTPKP